MGVFLFVGLVVGKKISLGDEKHTKHLENVLTKWELPKLECIPRDFSKVPTVHSVDYALGYGMYGSDYPGDRIFTAIFAKSELGAIHSKRTVRSIPLNGSK